MTKYYQNEAAGYKANMKRAAWQEREAEKVRDEDGEAWLTRQKVRQATRERLDREEEDANAEWERMEEVNRHDRERHQRDIQIQRRGQVVTIYSHLPALHFNSLHSLRLRNKWTW